MIPDDLARAVLERLLRRGGDFAEIYCESLRGVALAFEDRSLEEASAGVDRGVGLRLVRNGVTAFANGNDLAPEAMLSMASDLASTEPGGSARAVPLLARRPVASPAAVGIDPSAVPTEEKVRALVRADEAARAHDSRVVQVQARYRDSERSILVASSEGLLAEDRLVYTSMSVTAVAREGRLIKSATKSASGTVGFEIFDAQPPERLAREAARVACLQLTADPAPAGTFTVVLSAEAGGTMVHEACGHGLEGDFVLKGLSVYAGCVGRKVASDVVTVIDDGTLAGRRGSFGIDDEGTPSRRNVLIERGVLRGFLHSRRTAALTGAEPTGNGRRESYRHLPIPRMTNTMIAPGRDDPGEIVASVPDGIFVTDMGGGEVDIVSGNFVFHCTEAYRIRDGRIMEPLRDAILTGNGPDVLARIDRAGSDLGFQVGTCGKDGQGVPVSDAQPTLRIPGIVVGGQAR